MQQRYKIEKNEGGALAALLIAPEKFNYLMIVCHGFRGRKENSDRIYPFAEKLNKLGIAVLAFDFTGCGESDGDFSAITLSRQARDLKTVINYGYNAFKKPVILLGRSFGGSTILAGGSCDNRIAGYIFWSTPVELRETFTSMISEESYEKLIKGEVIGVWDEGNLYYLKPCFVQDIFEHNMDRYCRYIGKRPALIVHGQEDAVVAVYNARYMYNRINNVEMVIVDGADHRFDGKTEEREDVTVDWVKKYFTGPKKGLGK